MSNYTEETIHTILNEMFQIQQKSKQFIDLIASEDALSQHQLMLLIQLKLYGKMKITEIATIFHITPGAATSMCDKLEVEDLVKRERENEDRRVVRVNITEKGEQKIATIFKQFAPEKLDEISQVFKEVNRLMTQII